MATTDRPLDESTATLVSPDDHLHAKNLLNTPSKASTGVSSGTVSTEEPSTPEPPAAEFTAPVSIKCGWPNAEEGAKEQPPAEAKTLATEGPEGQPPWGSQGLAAAQQKAQAAPADANSGWSHLAKEQPETKDANSGWPHLAKEQPERKDADSGWPNVADPQSRVTEGTEGQPPWGGDANNPDHPKYNKGNGSVNSVTEGPEGQPPWGSQGLAAAQQKAQAAPADANSGWPHLAKEQPETKDADSGWPMPIPGDSNNPDSDAASKEESGTVSVQCGWPNGTAKAPPAVPGRSDPGSFGPRGQPPWGTQKLATVSPEGQPPWGSSNFAAANASQPTEGPEGQPPWGTKGLAAAHPDKPTDA